MIPIIETLESDIESLKRDLSDKQAELNNYRDSCKHLWGKVEYEPIIHEGYTIPADYTNGYRERKRCS